jgi:glycerol-3-phosphate dehydrogenase (NAD(P)+)
MDQLLEKDTPGASWTLLSGPMFAPEIMENKMSYGVLATKDKKVFKRIFALFAGGRLKLEYEKRAHGVALVAVLKNVYALFFGMLEGAGERNNSRGFFASRVIGEMRQIMKILKSEEKIIFGTAGMGDFIATINSEHSQNRKVGRKIFERGRAISKSEGLVSLPSLLKMLGPKAKQLPILYFLQRVISQRRDAKKEMEKFLRDI